MKYTYDNMQKALEYLIKNCPHDIEKFQALYNIKTDNDKPVKINYPFILLSDVWNAEEKVQLIRIYGYDEEFKFVFENTKYTDNPITDLYLGQYLYSLVDECIEQNNFTGLEASLSLGAIPTIESIDKIVAYVKEPIERYRYCELIVNYYKNKDTAHMSDRRSLHYPNLKTLPSLCSSYPMYTNSGLHPYEEKYIGTKSCMENICKTNDLSLVKLFMPTLKKDPKIINPLFKYALNTNNLDIVQCFIDEGADPNFQELEFIRASWDNLCKTPIKSAIDNNNLDIVKQLQTAGADFNYVDNSEQMKQYISNLKDNKEDELAKITWSKSPLEYALTTGPSSVLTKNVYYRDQIEDIFKNRMNIVRYLYENDATFTDGKMNYTDLICFAIKVNDLDATKYFFDEALRNNAKVDFAKIIDFIHIPGLIIENSGFTTYHYFYSSISEDATPFIKICEEYSKKLDSHNHNKNIKLLLEKMFADIASYNQYHYGLCKDLIYKYSDLLPKEELKDIPAVFGVDFNNLDEIINLGYDINCIKDGKTLLMKYIESNITPEEVSQRIDKLVSLGINPNYINADGESALSLAIYNLPKYDFGKYISCVDYDTKELNTDVEEYEKNFKELVKKLIELSNKEVIQSKLVQETVNRSIEPGYPQIIYNELLKPLAQKGFKVSDKYFTKSVTFLNDSYTDKYLTKPWEYLWNLYSNFDNTSIDSNASFPKIEAAKDIKWDSNKGKKLVELIKEHLNRNFITSINQIKNPNDKYTVGERYFYTDIEDPTNLQIAQGILLDEISKYFGSLDHRLIMNIIDSYPLIDSTALNENELLFKAIERKNIGLCIALMKRGATIVKYDSKGNDITAKIYSPDIIKYFVFLTNNKYKPNDTVEDILNKIGCNSEQLNKHKKK